MAGAFINKIQQIVLTNIEDEKFGVSELASEMGLSRSQILRKIKLSTGKSANKFISEIRLNEAVKLIQKEELTASEIAYKVGFSSPSYFNKCFLDQFGVTPGEFKKRYEEESSYSMKPESNFVQKKSKLNRAWLIAFLLLIVLVGFYSVSKKLNHTIAIAVLPLEDYSENQNNSYISNGITESITQELANNKSIRVIARGSSMRYKNSTLPYAEIAKDLGADLLLEGSIFPGKDTLLVVVQLIDPFPKEGHIWQSNYLKDTRNKIQLVRNVSVEIANGISSAILPDAQAGNTNLVNNRAKDLYERGHFIWSNQKTRENALRKAVNYLEESVKLEPKFAPAYVALAETYLSLNTLSGDNNENLKNRELAKGAIDKALELDPSLADIYITKGNLIGKLEWDWEQMKTMAERGLKLDPDNWYGHTVLSNYWVIKGNYQKAIDEAKIAEAMAPLNPFIGCLVAERYYIAGNFKESIEKYREVLEVSPDYGFAWNGIGYAYIQAGDLDKGIESWGELQLIMGNDSLAQYYTTASFNDCLNFWIIRAKKNTPRYCSNPVIISSVHMMLDKMPGALEYLQIAFRYKNEDLPVMLTYPDFYPLRNEPAFKEIAEKVGVVFPNYN